MSIIESLERGDVVAYGVPDKIVETTMSKIFFFGDRVVKVYKREAFRGDLDDPAALERFYAEDFYWNHTASPDVYVRLVEIDGEFLIEMAKVDCSQNLSAFLLNSRVTVDDVDVIVDATVQKSRELTRVHGEQLSAYLGRGWRSLFQEDLEDLRQFLHSANVFISRDRSDEVIDFLLEASSKEPYFSLNNILSAAIDNNPDNVLFIDGSVRFMDVMFPKGNWRVADEYLTIVQLATVASVLGGAEFGDAVCERYREHRQPAPRAITLMYEIWSATIQWAYRHLLGQHEMALKYEKWMLPKIEELKSLVE